VGVPLTSLTSLFVVRFGLRLSLRETTCAGHLLPFRITGCSSAMVSHHSGLAHPDLCMLHRRQGTYGISYPVPRSSEISPHTHPTASPCLNGDYDRAITLQALVTGKYESVDVSNLLRGVDYLFEDYSFLPPTLLTHPDGVNA
jgi:hypothetical protein